MTAKAINQMIKTVVNGGFLYGIHCKLKWKLM